MILTLGGSSDRREQGALSSCELICLNKGKQPSPSSQQPFLNAARRSPAFFKFPCGHLLVLGGCSGPVQHLNTGELIKFKFSDGCFSIDDSWEFLDFAEIQGFSCAAFCQIDDVGGFVFGGYDGSECVEQVLKVEGKEPHNVHLLASLPFGLKNACAVPAVKQRSIWLVGGWDGRISLRTIMEYDILTQKAEVKQLLPYPLESHAIAEPRFNPNNICFIIGGFDGVSLRKEILVMDLETGKIIGEVPNVFLRKPKENCLALCCAYNDEGGVRREFLVVVGGWDGRKAANDVELFEVLDQPPWLRKKNESEEKGFPDEFVLECARNRPVSVFLSPSGL